MNKLLRELCLEVANGDIGSENFNRLWIEAGIPLEGQEFEVANLILAKVPELSLEELQKKRTYH